MTWIVSYFDKQGKPHTKKVSRESTASMWVIRYREKGYTHVTKYEKKPLQPSRTR